MLWHQQLAMMMKNLEQNKKKQLSIIAQKKMKVELNIELDTKLPYILEIQQILKNIEKERSD